jgi:hypothetical protein
MTAPRFSDVLSSGAGLVDYAFHVAGFPWAACSSARLAAALTADSLAYVYFSPRGGGIGEHKLGNHMHYVPALQSKGLRWSWKHDDADGLSGGDWSVNIAEMHPGVDWSVVDGESTTQYSGIQSSPVWGIPGISQIFDSANDTAIRVGDIYADIETDDYTFTVRDVRGLGSFLSAISLDGAVLWIGHEAILIDSAVDNSDGTFTCTVNAEGRGLWRSRIQPHAVNEYAAMSEFVATAPLGGIAGRPAYLWAFASGDQGTTYGAPTLVNHGKVQQGISIKDGIASIKCSSPMEWLKSPSAIPDYSGQLKRYVLQRGEIGTSETSAFGTVGWGASGIKQSVMRAPHLIIYERDIDGSSYVEKVSQVWLCAKNSYVVFDTVDELIAAVQTELDKLSESSADQVSGDDTTGNDRQSLLFRYRVSREGIAVDKPVTDDWWRGGGLTKTRIAKISGVIPVVFGLTHPKSIEATVLDNAIAVWSPVNNENLRRDEVAKRLAFPGQYSGSLGDRSAYTLSGPIGTYGGTLSSLTELYLQSVPPYDLLPGFYEDSWKNLEKKQTSKIKDYKRDVDFYPRYYYEFGRDDDVDHSQTSRVFTNEGVYAAPITANEDRLWIERIRGHQPVIGGQFVLCDAEGMPQLEGEIDDSGEDGDYFYVRISSTAPGSTAAALVSPDGNPAPMRGVFNLISWIRSQSVMVDPWAVSQGVAPISTDDVVELFKGVVGASYSVILSPSQSLYWVPEVGAVEDDLADSWIDWADLGDKLSPIFKEEHYVYRPGGQQFHNTFLHFLRSHGLVPYLELYEGTNYDLWRMKFRPIGTVNYSDAVMYARSISSDTFTDDYDVTRDVASGYIYSQIKLKINYDGEDYGADIDISDKSAYAQNGYASKTYTIEDRVTQCPALRNLATDKGVQSEISEQFTAAILPHISKPRPISTAKCTIKSMLLPVGGDVIVTDAYGKNPFSGAIGYTGLPGLVTAVDVDLDRLTAKCSWRLARSVCKGWAPALYLPVGSLFEDPEGQWDIDITGGANSAASHEFSGASDPVDWSRFDCWDYDPLTGEYGARSCSCGDYAVRIFRPDRPVDTVYYGTARVTGLQPGGTPAMTLFCAEALPTAFPMILEFGLYDDAESCQRDLYVAYCGDDGEIGTGAYPADFWV